MSKKKSMLILDEEERVAYKKIEIDFPFCLKNHAGTVFMRYLNDGREEMVCFDGERSSLYFGNYLKGSRSYNESLKRNSQVMTTEKYEEGRFCWMDKQFNWLRVVASKNEIISNEKYEEAFDKIIGEGYALHLDPEYVPEPKEIIKVVVEEKEEKKGINGRQSQISF